MRGELTLSLGTLFAFLLVLTRMAGVFVFIPMPTSRTGADMAKIVLSVSVTLAMYPIWPKVDATGPMLGRMTGWILQEAALGTAIGLTVAFVSEAFQFAAQMLALQAGYSFASTIDPQTQADSGVLQMFGSLAAGLLFFSLGFDAEILRACAASLNAHPPGTFLIARPTADAIIHLGAGIFSVGLRLAMPLIAMLIMIDIALALLGRINAQLQLLSLAFPIKMLATLVMLAWLTALFPRMFRGYGMEMLTTVRSVAGF